jgi:hypothetical protein
MPSHDGGSEAPLDLEIVKFYSAHEFSYCRHHEADKLATLGPKPQARPFTDGRMCPLCDKFTMNLGRHKSPTSNASRGIRAMDFSNTVKPGRDIGLDQDHDSVTTWIQGLAIGMIVLGTVFAVLDWSDFLPHVAAPQQLSHMATDHAAL